MDGSGLFVHQRAVNEEEDFFKAKQGLVDGVKVAAITQRKR